MRKRIFTTLASLAAAAALVVAPLVTAGASATALKGDVGKLVQWVPQSNQESYWENLYSAHQADCVKVDGVTSSPYATVSADGLTVTLKPFDSTLLPGDHWELLVVKAGNLWNNVVVHPEAGVAYASPLNNGGKQAVISHYFVCSGTTPDEPQPQSVTPALTWTLPSCDAAGVLTQGAGVTWTSSAGENGTTTWTATPAPGTVFPADVQTVWPNVPNLAQLTERCNQPPDDVTTTTKTTLDCEASEATIITTTTTIEYVWDAAAKKWVAGEPASVDAPSTRALTEGELATCDEPEQPTTTTEVITAPWADGTWACGDTSVEQTRTVTTTVYVDGEPGEPEVKTEHQTRTLTQQEIGTCPLVPGDIRSVCVGDVPFLSYDVDLPEGFVPSSQTPVTITFVNTKGGDDYVITGQALSGKLLWPGASDGTPKMWPGWDLVDGQYVETAGNFAWTRDHVTVRFDVNPTYSTTVDYPEATAECANPAMTLLTPEDPTDDPEDPTPSVTPTPTAAATGDTLAITGGAVQLGALGLGALAVLAGVGMTIVSIRRSRRV
ncbi:hypothetical protein ACH3VR_17430 [Microbacterium sp. B2969]|uniref:Uncharacterized protein n=1 Tax=Microbacterium alkaliflavum TaxID=3248839 RepID=A0ABW7QBW9_9MICO